MYTKSRVRKLRSARVSRHLDGEFIWTSVRLRIVPITYVFHRTTLDIASAAAASGPGSLFPHPIHRGLRVPRPSPIAAASVPNLIPILMHRATGMHVTLHGPQLFGFRLLYVVWAAWQSSVRTGAPRCSGVGFPETREWHRDIGTASLTCGRARLIEFRLAGAASTTAACVLRTRDAASDTVLEHTSTRTYCTLLVRVGVLTPNLVGSSRVVSHTPRKYQRRVRALLTTPSPDFAWRLEVRRYNNFIYGYY